MQTFEVSPSYGGVGTFYSDGTATWTINGIPSQDVWQWRWNGKYIEERHKSQWPEWEPSFKMVTTAYIEYINQLVIGDA